MKFVWILVCAICFAFLGCGKEQGTTSKLQAAEETALPPRVGPDTTVFDTAPVAIHSVSPVYPEDARVAGLTGTTQIEVSVDASGTVVATQVILTSGNASLDRAAEDAARQWTFKPAMLRGQPVPSRMVLPVRFELQ